MALSITSTTAFVSKLNSANPLTITTTTSVKPSSSTSTSSSSSSSQPGISSFGRVALPEKKLANEHLISSTSNIGNYLSANSFVAAAPMRRKLLPTSIKESCVENSCLARVWRKIQGCNNWKDLMQPLNPLLRDEIIRYGEFVTACYKAFDLDPNSKRYLNCKYGKKNMMSQVGMENSGYEVTKYIYATPDISIPTQTGTCCSRWIGYVAVSSDEETRRLGRRDVVITFRGTVTNTEWIANFMSSLTPARLDPQNPLPDVKVESGFLSLYTSDDRSCRFGVGSCRQQLLSEVSRILNMYKGEEMSITLAGHSMGSSLAVLLAYDIAELGVNKTRNQNEQIPVTVYSFGGPRVGNSSFKNRCEELGVKVLRVVNINDPVTKLPGVLFNENFRVFGGKYEFPWSCSCYAHVGVELALDFFEMQNPSCVHDLETYIGLLKCPKRAQTQKDSINGAHEDILNKALMFLFGAQLLVTLCNL